MATSAWSRIISIPNTKANYLLPVCTCVRVYVCACACGQRKNESELRVLKTNYFITCSLQIQYKRWKIDGKMIIILYRDIIWQLKEIHNSLVVNQSHPLKWIKSYTLVIGAVSCSEDNTLMLIWSLTKSFALPERPLLRRDCQYN